MVVAPCISMPNKPADLAVLYPPYIYLCQSRNIAMNDERIITAAVVTTGKKSDGHYLQELVEKTDEKKLKVKL